MDRIIEIALGIITVIEMISGEELLGEMWDQIRIIEDKTIEISIEEIIEVIIIKEVGVSLEKDSFQIMPDGMTEVVVLGLDQVQDLVLTEIGLDVTSVRDHFANKCPTSKIEKETEQVQQMYNMHEEETSLKTLITGTYDSLNWIGSANEIATDHLNF